MSIGRHDWKCYLPARVVRESAEKKADYHRTRVAFWSDELEVANRELKENGIQLRDVPVTGGYRVEHVVDLPLSKRVTECREKLDNHQRLVTDYSAYVRLMELIESAQEDEEEDCVPLGPEDILYFDIPAPTTED